MNFFNKFADLVTFPKEILIVNFIFCAVWESPINFGQLVDYNKRNIIFQT